MLSQKKIAFPGILKYFSSCLEDSADVLLVDFISEMDNKMIHLDRVKKLISTSVLTFQTVYDQMSCVLVRHLSIYSATSGGFQVFRPIWHSISYECQQAESSSGFHIYVSPSFSDSAPSLCLHTSCRN